MWMMFLIIIKKKPKVTAFFKLFTNVLAHNIRFKWGFFENPKNIKCAKYYLYENFGTSLPFLKNSVLRRPVY